MRFANIMASAQRLFGRKRTRSRRITLLHAGWATDMVGALLRGRQPKLSPKQQQELKRMHTTGNYTIADLTEIFSVSRPTVYRTLQRVQPSQLQ